MLVIDTPENCLDCRFCYESDEGVEACCSISDDDKDTSLTKKIDCEYGYCQGKPDWCPLKPLPEKKEYVDPTSSAKAKKKILLQLVGTLALI
ncbi:MAG: hypothetical protein [Bacteriophage sp.]|nr:MAG: hypothetical protein [Bacteriophage sp.]